MQQYAAAFSLNSLITHLFKHLKRPNQLNFMLHKRERVRGLNASSTQTITVALVKYQKILLPFLARLLPSTAVIRETPLASILGSKCETNFDSATVFFTFHNIIDRWWNAPFRIHCFQRNPAETNSIRLFKI